MQSTMGDVELGVSMILEHGRSVYPNSRVVTFTGDGARVATFAEVAGRAAQLAHALRGIGIDGDQRVGTLMFNGQEHQEAYFAIPGMGAVMHTLNFRLHPDQLAYVATHAQDRVIIFEGFLAPALLPLRSRLTTVTHYVMVGDAPPSVEVPADVIRYEDFIAGHPTTFPWPQVPERNAAAMCYTSGTTGDPKGVVYSQRSTFLHSLSFIGVAQATERDAALMIVPMFHVNAWGMPYACWFAGTDMLMPSRFLQADPLAKFMEAFPPTFSAGVPTVWTDLLRYADANKPDWSSIRNVIIGGSAVPASLIEGFRDRHGLQITQAWGMTETSPLGAMATPPRGTRTEDELRYRVKTGRPLPGVALRIVGDDGTVLPHDGTSVGEMQAYGPWVTASYQGDPAPEKFQVDPDGKVWLRTGDVATVDAEGYFQITDRSKDVIKSGGEWISSVDLENTLMGHHAVAEAAVVAVPDAQWDERPLACVVVKQGETVTADELAAFLRERVASWWVPERWSFIAEVPKTSTLKFDKKVLRARHGAGELAVETLEKPSRR
jgi:fatty-acyl-CoA synthase